MVIAELIGLPEVISKLKEIQINAPSAIVKAMKRLSLQLVRHVVQDKLTGQVLHVQTGKLRRSITLQIDENPNDITAIVGTNTEYARIHEFGFNGTVSVKEHLRRTKASFNAARKIGWSKSMSKQLGREASMGAGTVRAHSMKMNMPERSFLRSALADMAPTIQETLQAAMAKALRGEL